LRKKVGVLGKTGCVFGRFENGQRKRAAKVAIFYNPYLVYDT
jgi:flagellar hook protein FlgE